MSDVTRNAPSAIPREIVGVLVPLGDRVREIELAHPEHGVGVVRDEPGDGAAPGSLFRNPGLAATYRRVVDHAESRRRRPRRPDRRPRRAWYRGFVAAAIDPFVRDQASARRPGPTAMAAC